MRKKLDAIQSNPRIFATLVLNCANGFYVYRLLSGADGLEVQVSRVFSTKKEAADHMFLQGQAWAGVHDHVGTGAHQAEADMVVQGSPVPPRQPTGYRLHQPPAGFPPQQPQGGYPPPPHPQGGYPPPHPQGGYPPQQYPQPQYAGPRYPQGHAPQTQPGPGMDRR